MSAPSSPIFQRRKNRTKRRRTRFRDASPEPTVPSPKEPDTVKIAMVTKPVSLKATERRTTTKRQRKIGAAPSIDGYDQTASVVASNCGGGYSVHELEQLRKSTQEGLKRQQKETQKTIPTQVGPDISVGKHSSSNGSKGQKNTKNLDWMHESGAASHGSKAKTRNTRTGRYQKRRPDPFSEEWKGGTGAGAIMDDVGIAVVDDFTGVQDSGFIPIPVDVDNSVKLKREVAQESDTEWESELMKRAGQRELREDDEEMQRRAMQIIREAEESIRKGRPSFEKCLKMIESTKAEWEHRYQIALQKTGQLESALEDGRDERLAAEKKVDKEKERATFYDELDKHVGKVVKMLVQNRPAIMAHYEERLRLMEVQTERLQNSMSGGVDEFGRTRGAKLVDEEDMESNEFETRVVMMEKDDVKSAVKLKNIFYDWRSRYPDDYMNAHGDVGLGKLLGRLFLAQDDLWSTQLSGLNALISREMYKSAHAVKTLSAMIKCKWYPRDRKSCEKFANLAESIIEVDGQAKNDVESAFQCRAEWEIQVCRKLNDRKAMIDCAKGLKYVEDKLKSNVGASSVIMAAKEIGCTEEELNGT